MFKKVRKNKEKGFVILISVIISTLLTSLGIFISNTIYRELLLVTSAEESQKAFYAADSAMECAVKMFVRNSHEWGDVDNRISGKLECNNHFFSETSPPNYGANTDDIIDTNGVIRHQFIYFVNFSPTVTVGNERSRTDPVPNPDELYAKVIIINEPLNGTGKITVYGHNKYSGRGIAERSLEVEFK